MHNHKGRQIEENEMIHDNAVLRLKLNYNKSDI